MSVSTDVFQSIAFPSVGVYDAVLFLEGEKVFAFPLVITQKPSSKQGLRRRSQ